MAKQELKYKRLKVGHACYVCRNKKIKCDGLRPCMQCKARGRNCESSVTEPSTDTVIGTESGNSDTNTDDGSHHSTIESDDDSNLFSQLKDDTTSPSLNNNNKLWSSNVIYKTSKDFENNQQHIPGLAEYPTNSGTFTCRWRNEPPLPHKYSHPIEMPSSEIQLHLIDLFFETKYKMAPIIPKKLFYEHLRTKGPMITPFLLNSIYCLVSAHATLPDVPKPSVFYNRGKKLLDDFLDTPRVSTVAALCILALYEPLPTEMVNQHCRSWIYGGMAFRMCLGLGLNIDASHALADSSFEDVQLCRRVFWSCYCLDKMQSSRCESSWSIPPSLIKTALPQVLPGDDEIEKQIVLAFEQRILLALISEEGFQIRASFAIRGEVFDSKFYDQLEQYKLKIFSWKNNLKSPRLWGFDFYQTIEQVMNQPKFSPIVSYVRVVYYYMLTELFFCLPEGHEKSLEQRVYAAQLTRSISNTCEDPVMVIHYEFLTHATIGAIRVHSYYLNDSDPDISRQSRYLFKQSIQILQTFQKYATIPDSSAVLNHLPVIYEQSDISYSSPSSQNRNIYIDSPQIYSDLNYKGDHDAYTTQPLQQQFQQFPLAQFEQISIDSYGTDIIPSFRYQNRDTISVSSSRQSLNEFGYGLSVSFSDPTTKQLWDPITFQGVSNDIGSSVVSTPDDTGFPQTVSSFSSCHSDWNSSSMKTTDLTYCPQNNQHLCSTETSPPPSIRRQHNYNIPHLPHEVNSVLCGQSSDRNLPVPTILPLLQTYSNLMPNFNFDGLHDQTYYSD